jgi:hypothetical protein
VIVAAGPDWASETTAIGTVAVAVVAVGVALFAEWRAGKRVAAERARGDKQLREERRIALERDQFAEAYAVQVMLLKSRGAGEDEAQRLIATIVNHGTQTITQIEARFSPDGNNVITPQRQGLLPVRPDVAALVRDLPEFVWLADAGVFPDRLTPWDTGMLIETDLIGAQLLPNPRVMVRWTDRWGTRWEYKGGELRPVDESTQW